MGMFSKSAAVVSVAVGLDSGSTLDADTTLKNLPLYEERARMIIREITCKYVSAVSQ